MKGINLMKSINEKIVEQMLTLWHGVLTRKAFPDILKAYIMNEYSSQMTQEEHVKIIQIINNMNKKKSEQFVRVDWT